MTLFFQRIAAWRPLLGLLFLLALGSLSHATPFINEIYFHPLRSGYLLDPTDPEDVRQEWIELHHTGTTPVDVSGWRFTRGITFTFPPGTVIPPGGFLIVAADVDTFRSLHSHVTAVVGGWQGSLSNNGETLELADAAGNVIDRLKYDTEGDWSARRRITQRDRNGYPYGWRWWNEADGGGRSLELVQPALPHGEGQNWSVSAVPGGTPGAANSTAAPNAPPLILEATHYPPVPRSTQPVRITARLVDEQPIGLRARVWWRVSAMTPAAFNLAPMRDDGEEGDQRAGDGLFTAVLPPQPHGTVVEYRIEAFDAGDRRRSWPRLHPEEESSPRDNALYQVDDPPYTGQAPLFRLIQPVSELAEFDSQPFSGNNRTSQQYLACLVATMGGVTEVRQQCSVRIRGAGSRSSRPRNVRLSLPNNAPWNDKTAFNLNGRFSYLQVLGARLAQASGLQVADAWPVAVRFNGQHRLAPDFIWPGGGSSNYPYHYGLYACVEPLNREFIDRHFSDNPGGNLYSMRSTRQAEWRVAPGGPSTYADFYRSEGWEKDNNSSAQDWTDLHHFVSQMTAAAQNPDDAYLEKVSQLLDVDQWILAQAVSTILTDGETKLVTGRDDDYSLYRGSDGRMRYIQHDLDTILGLGDNDAIGLNRLPYTIFDQVEPGARGDVFDKLIPFYQQPEVLAKYYTTLHRLLTEGPFTEEAFTSLVTAELTRGAWAEADIQPVRESILTFMRARRADILQQISRPLTAITNLATQEGYPVTSSSSASLQGTYDASRTAQVLINGLPATLNPRTSRYTGSATNLLPGLNRVVVEEFDQAGNPLRSVWLDIWRPDAAPTVKSGVVSQSETWPATASPYLISGPLTVTHGATLTLEPGTTVYFADGAQLIVTGGARLHAVGTPSQHIRFTREPGTTAQPGGLSLQSAPGVEHQFAWCDFEFFGPSPALHATGTDLSLRHCSWAHCEGVYLELDFCTFRCTDSVFAARPQPANWPPAVDDPQRHTLAAPPLVRSTTGLRSGGYGLFARNVFGHTYGDQPVLSFTSTQPGAPALQLRENFFAAATHAHVQLVNTDAVISGNVFLNAHADSAREAVSAAAGALQGWATGSTAPEWTVYHNVFVHIDQVLQLGRPAATANPHVAFLNNTVVHVTPEAAYPGPREVSSVFAVAGNAWLYARHNVITEAAALITPEPPPNAHLELSENVLPVPWNGPGSGNLVAPPSFAAAPALTELNFAALRDAHHHPRLQRLAREALALRPHSPGQGQGLGGADWGAAFPTTLHPLNQPAPVLTTDFIGLLFGPTGLFPSGRRYGVTTYRWSLDDGPLSPTTPIQQPLELSGLPPGPHTLRVWDSEALANASDPAQAPPLVITWTVDPSYMPPVRLNEVLARNEGSFPPAEEQADFIELYNPTPFLVDLSGWGLSDDPAAPMKYTFPSGSTLQPGGYLVVRAASGGSPADFYTGFALNADGEAVILSRPTGEVVDAVSFGFQLPDLSIGRVGPAGEWRLTYPTPGAANRPHPVAGPSAVKLNEWLAAREQAHREDMIELYNTSPLPADISGCWLSDDPLRPQKHALKPHSFIAPHGFAVLQADDVAGSLQANHLPFRLSAYYDWLVWSAPDGRPLDQVPIASANPDESLGRVPDGTGAIQSLELPSFGLTNVNGILPVTETTVLPLVPHGYLWRYQDQTFDSPPPDANGRSWWEPDYALEITWPQGPSPLGRDNDFTNVNHPGTGVPPFFGTDFGQLGTYQSSRLAYFFRTTFDFSETDPSEWTLRLSRWIDDGYILYLNGQEIDRRAMNGPAPRPWNARATSSVGNATEELIQLPAGWLQPGRNTLAAQVHQDDTSSGDIVFSVALEAVRERTTPGEPDPERERMKALLASLRITEIMFDPPEGNEYEFLELTNFSSEQSLNLEGVRFIEGIDFVFPTLTLPPGGRVILAKNPAAFALRHGSGFIVVGPYDGQLSNQGEALTLALPQPYTAQIQRFRFEPSWYSATAGGGFSLEFIGATGPGASLALWTQRENWQASAEPGGSPGRAHEPSTFAAWLTTHGLITTIDDPDRDALPPVLEYAWRLSPTQIETLPPLTVSPAPAGGYHVSFIFPAAPPHDVLLTVEASPTLTPVDWEPLAIRAANGTWTGLAPITAEPAAPGLTRYTLHNTSPATSQRYYRLRVQALAP